MGQSAADTSSDCGDCEIVCVCVWECVKNNVCVTVSKLDIYPNIRLTCDRLCHTSVKQKLFLHESDEWRKRSETVKRLMGTSANELRKNTNETLIRDCQTVKLLKFPSWKSFLTMKYLCSNGTPPELQSTYSLWHYWWKIQPNAGHVHIVQSVIMSLSFITQTFHYVLCVVSV